MVLCLSILIKEPAITKQYFKHLIPCCCCNSTEVVDSHDDCGGWSDVNWANAERIGIPVTDCVVSTGFDWGISATTGMESSVATYI